MSNKAKPATDLAAIINPKGYLLEKGHRFERGPTYEGQGKNPCQRG